MILMRTEIITEIIENIVNKTTISNAIEDKGR